MSKEFAVSWEEFHRSAKALAWKLEGKAPLGNWKGLIAVTRGGLVPGCLVARELDIRTIETISVSSYDHQNQTHAEILKPPMPEIGQGEGWLVIDDLADTGNTFRALRQYVPKAHFACIYAKPLGMPTADTFLMEVSQDTWIFLPWEDQDFPSHIHESIGGHLRGLHKPPSP